MADLIDRQAAIDLFPDDDLEYDTKGGYVAPHLARRMICQLPSAQPEQRWISCSERMPEEHEWIGTKTFGTTISDEVYVTFESPKGERFTKHLSFQNGKVSSFTQREIDVFYKGAVPIAWMPLPASYKGE